MFLVRNLARFPQPITYSRINVGGFCSINSSGEDSNENETKAPVDPLKDRSRIIPVETSIRYLQSDAFKQTYGDNRVWVLYRRNFPGQFAPRQTRQSCIRKKVISCGNPCPICRDEYLVLNYRNVALLQQFISEHTGQILSAYKTGVCQKRYKELVVAIERAWDHGYITFDVPFREYNYEDYTEDYENILHNK